MSWTVGHQIIHRPGCEPDARDVKCWCRKRVEKQASGAPWWKDFYESESEYEAHLRSVVRRGPMWYGPGGIVA